MPEMNYDEYLALAETPQGAILDVSSDLFSMALFAAGKGFKFDAEGLLEALKRQAGDEGTIMIRAFSWDFCIGKPFHTRGTRSVVGSLGITAMGRQDFRRTQHPIYSWFVWGKEQERLCSMDFQDCFAEDSMFRLFYDEHALQLGLGKQRATGFTMAHYAEVNAGVPYRAQKLFTGDYYDEEERCTQRTYATHVRPLNIPVKNTLSVPEMREALIHAGIRRELMYQDALPISVVKLPEAADFIMRDIRENDGKLIMNVDGVPGITASGVDWSTAVYT